MATASPEWPAFAVVERVADHEGVDQSDLDPPLEAVIDVDALNALVVSSRAKRSGSTVVVRFTYLGYSITVRSSGSVTVDDRFH